jgi:2,3-bisphosphoglycerate-dependent phosphoglycerate mutase
MAMSHSSELCLIRHAESQANLEKKEIGAGERSSYPSALKRERDADVALTPRGVKQAGATGSYLAERYPPFDVCYVSPWTRTRQTFEHILTGYPPEEQEQIRRRTVFDERLREHERGILLWLTPEQIAKRYPEEAHRLHLDGEFYYRPLGGESWADVTQRLASVYQTWAQQHAGARILVVTHSIVLLCVRHLLLRLSERATLEVARDEHPHNCAICRFTFAPPADEQERPSLPEWRLEEWNTVAYGPDLASTVPEEQQRQGLPGGGK